MVRFGRLPVRTRAVQDNAMPARRGWWIPPAGLVLVYLYSFPYLEKIRNANELPRIYLVHAIVDRGALDIDAECRRWGGVVDTAVYGGRTFSNKAPGLSFAGVPVYAALKRLHGLAGRAPPTLREETYFLRLLCVTLPQLAFLLVLWRLSGRFSQDPVARRLVVLGYALGTLALPFSLLYIAHEPATVLIGCAFYLLVGAAPAWRLVLAGLCAGAAVLVEYQAAFFALPLLAYAMVTVRPVGRLGFAVLGALPPAGALAAYHRACFGSIWRTAYPYSTSPAYRALHQQGLLGLTHPTWRHFFDGFLAPGNGLFVLAPWLVLGLVGLWLLLRARAPRGPRNREALLCAAMLLTAVWFLSSFLFAGPGWHGWEIGPRYIAIAVPFFALPSARAFERARAHSGLAIGAAALLFSSVVLHVGASLTFPLWPDKLWNPVVELAWPLLRDGFAPYNLGRLVGLPGRLQLWPAFAVALALVLWALPGARVRVVAAVLGCALLLLFWLAPRTPSPDSVGVARWIESIWEPPPAQPPPAQQPPAPAQAAHPPPPPALR